MNTLDDTFLYDQYLRYLSSERRWKIADCAIVMPATSCPHHIS